jgi:hypothetical protein
LLTAGAVLGEVARLLMVVSLMPESFAAAAHLRKCPLSMKSMRGASGRERYRRWGDDPTMDVKVAAERPVNRAFGRDGVQPCAA